MNLQLENTIAYVENFLDNHGKVVSSLGKTIGVNGNQMTSQEYNDLLTQYVSLNDNTYGVGVWYDYNGYHTELKYFGPYAYRTGDSIIFDDSLYSTDDYDYPHQTWYISGKNAGNNIVWSSPFKDETLGTSFVTASQAFYDSSKNFRGVVTGDIDLSSLQTMISGIKIGETGRAFLIDNNGLYIAEQDGSKVMNTNLLEDPNTSLSALGQNLLSGNPGSGVFSDDAGKNNIYYAPISSTGWILAIMEPQKELNQPITSMIYKLVTLFILALVVLSIIIFKLIKGVVNPIVLLTALFQKAELGDFKSNIPKEFVNRKDELGLLGVSFEKLAQNMQEKSNNLAQISQGNLNVAIDMKSDKDILSKSLIDVVENLKNLEIEVKRLTASATEGNLSVRGDITKFQGKYQDIVIGINNTLNAVVEPLTVAADYMNKISKGNIPEKISEEYHGDFNLIKENLNHCIENINALVADVNMLSKAATEGQLEIQADEDNHSGDYKKIIQGFNNTLFSILEPINEARQVMTKMAVNDFSTSMSGSYEGRMNEFAQEINLVHARLLTVQDAFIRISKGDTSKLEEFVIIGQRSENDQLVPALIGTLSTIDDLVKESRNLAMAGINGDLSVRSDISRFSGGYSDIVEGFNQTLDAIQQPISEASAVLEKMADGNLDIEIKGAYLGSYAVIKNSINDTLQSFNGMMGNINHSADKVASGSKQVSYGSQALAQGATEQASSMEELNASIAEVKNQTDENAKNANMANKLSSLAQTNAENGNRQMQQMLTSMSEINESSEKISNIIKVIDDIAFQTNILALNAAVEAARAGQHGKGFAVVAEEVRNLAGRSAEAAKETADLIEGSITKVYDGTVIANNTAGALNEIVSDISKVADLVAKIDSASNEQTSSINQIYQGIDQVSQVVQTNSATAEESAAASQELYTQAELLKSMVSRFELK